MEVYEDFQCPVCAQVLAGRRAVAGQPSTSPRASCGSSTTTSTSSAAGANDESLITALGAYCANEQGKYWPYAHWIYNNQDGENQGGFRTERVIQIAVAAGVEEAGVHDAASTPRRRR